MRPITSRVPVAESMFLSLEGSVSTRGHATELFSRRFNHDYEDLCIVTSADDDSCTLGRLIGIYQKGH
jgi:hypothetical protein